MFNNFYHVLFLVISTTFGCIQGMESPAGTPALQGPEIDCAAFTMGQSPVAPFYSYGFVPVVRGPVDLYEAAVFGDITTIAEAAGCGADLNRQRPVDGWTLAHIAATTNNIALMDFLCENGADISVKDLKGNTPLHMAFLGHGIDVAHYLVCRQWIQYRDNVSGGVFLDLYSRNFAGQTSLDAARYVAKRCSVSSVALNLSYVIRLMEQLIEAMDGERRMIKQVEDLLKEEDEN